MNWIRWKFCLIWRIFSSKEFREMLHRVCKSVNSMRLEKKSVSYHNSILLKFKITFVIGLLTSYNIFKCLKFLININIVYHWLNLTIHIFFVVFDFLIAVIIFKLWPSISNQPEFLFMWATRITLNILFQPKKFYRLN